MAIEILSNPRRKWWDRVKIFTMKAQICVVFLIYTIYQFPLFSYF